MNSKEQKSNLKNRGGERLKKKKKSEEPQRPMGDQKAQHSCHGVPEVEEKMIGEGKISEEIRVENFPNVVININLQIQKALGTPRRIN